MAQGAAFLFEQDFSDPTPEVEEEVEPTFTLAEYEAGQAAARADGDAAGFDRGQQDAQAAANAALAAKLEAVATACNTLITQLPLDREQAVSDAFDLALTSARALADGLITAEPAAEIEALLRDCLGPLRKTPHLVIRLAPEGEDALTQSLKTLLRERGFEGRVMLFPDPEIAAGDCRIEWADGAIARERAEIDRRIAQRVDAYLAGRGAPERASKQQPETASQPEAPQPEAPQPDGAAA